MQRSGEALGVERLLDLPLRREVEQVRNDEEQAGPRRVQVLRGQAEHRECDQHHGERVQHVEELRSADPEPVEGNEQQVADVARGARTRACPGPS